MGKIEAAAARANLWTSLAERCARLAGAFGWDITPAKLFNAVWPTVLMMGALIWESVPWYFIVPAAVFLFGSLLHLYAGVARALAVQGVKKATLSDVAAACEKASEGFYDFTEARAEEVEELLSISRPGPGEDWSTFHDLRAAKEKAFMHRLKARVGTDIGAAIAMLAPLGIKIDSDLRSLHWADQQARYLGALAKLLRNGHLEEAKALKDHQFFF